MHECIRIKKSRGWSNDNVKKNNVAGDELKREMKNSTNLKPLFNNQFLHLHSHFFFIVSHLWNYKRLRWLIWSIENLLFLCIFIRLSNNMRFNFARLLTCPYFFHTNLILYLNNWMFDFIIFLASIERGSCNIYEKNNCFVTE